MTNSIKEMLIGNILGDGHIRRTGLTKASMVFGQSILHKEYITHLHTLLKEANLTTRDMRLVNIFDSRYNKSNQSLHFSTYSVEALRPLADLFLNNENKKIIPKNIAELLSPRVLAFWLMDDGQAVKRGGITLCTDSFSLEEVELLRNALTSKLNLSTTIHNKKGKKDVYYKRIYISKPSLDILKPLIKIHLHESMLYKINE